MQRQRIYDKNRLILKRVLSDSGIITNEKESIRFSEFLTQPHNNYYFQSYMLLCSGFIDEKEIPKRIEDMILEFKFQMGDSYSYSELFSLDEGWYEFYKENAYPSGQRKPDEERRGVDKTKVDDIMSIKKKISSSLTKSVELFMLLKVKLYTDLSKTDNKI